MEKSVEVQLKNAEKLAVVNNKKKVERIRKLLPLEGLSEKEYEFVFNYSGNVKRAVKKTYRASGAAASLKALKLMQKPQIKKCIEVLDNAFERFGLLTSLELRSMLENIALDPDTLDTTKIQAIKLLMTNKGMLDQKTIVEMHSTHKEELTFNFAGPKSNFLLHQEGELIEQEPSRALDNTDNE